jgi:hypothetical protein
MNTNEERLKQMYTVLGEAEYMMKKAKARGDYAIAEIQKLEAEMSKQQVADKVTEKTKKKKE